MGLNLIKAATFAIICSIANANGYNGTQCYRVELDPTAYFSVYNMYSSEVMMNGAELMYHLFDGTDNVLAASNASTSHLCINDFSDCHYWFFHGNGDLRVIKDDDDNDDNDEVVEEGKVSFHEPMMLQMGNCSHECGDDQQVKFAGLMADEPTLYDDNYEVIPTLFPKPNKDENKQNDDNEVVMKTTCIQPSKCYKLVGSSLYVVTSSNSSNSTTREEEGSTFLGYQTLGDENSCRSSYCDSQPLLADTARGREILQALSSVSKSDALANVQSPQYKAACWIIHDDARQVGTDYYNVVQRYILALIFYALGGRDWNWSLDFLTPKHECRWNKWVMDDMNLYQRGDNNNGNGVHCDRFGYVSGLLLSSNNMVGTIPFEIASLVGVGYVDVAFNLIFGPIPSELGNMRSLSYVFLIFNALTGSIPEGFGGAKEVHLVANLLTGTIPLLDSKDLHVLNLRDNMLIGTIQHGFSKWNNLTYLNFGDNRLIGTIPEDISTLANLGELSLNINYLTGRLPSKILELPELSLLYLNENSFTGTIPSRVAVNSPLAIVSLHHNMLTGNIPSEISLLGNLRFARLNNNLLSGEIPSNITNLQNLVELTIHSNNLTGDVPFQDCEVSPRVEADCDTPKIINCPCCITCHGMFTSFSNDKELDKELSCSSGELTLVVQGLILGDYFSAGLYMQMSGEENFLSLQADSSLFFTAENTTYKHTICVSMSGCYTLGINNEFGDSARRLNLFINNELVLDEHIPQRAYSEFEFGYDAEGTLKKKSCDNFELCDVMFVVNSTKRDKLDQLIRITGIQVFNDTSSSYYKAGCSWVSHFEGENDYDYTYSTLLHYFLLTAFFYETNGNEWVNSSNWATNTSVCSWYGIGCDSYEVVTTIRLPFNNIRGSLPTEIAELSGLEYISLDGNLISGTLPKEIGTKLILLNYFNVSSNRLWGGIPSEFSNLVELEKVDASHNQLTGSLPKDIGNLEKLEVFDIFNNTCAESLPSSINDLHSLKQLSLGSNLFTGSAIGVQELSNLESLDLSQNFFTGSVPVGLSQNKLRVLELWGNQLRGSIPTSIEELESLETLYLYDNFLTGNLPGQIGNLEKLKRVSLSNNNFKGELPSALGMLENLSLLHIQNNQLVGSGDIFDYTVVDYISDCGNTFTGPARIECMSCSLCCNVNGDCISKEMTWPGRVIPLIRVSPQAFVFFAVLFACMFFLMCVFVYQPKPKATSDFSICHGFQVRSVYCFFLTNSIGGNVVAAATVTIQLAVLANFLQASDFSASKNEWKYSMSCPDDGTVCEDSRDIQDLAWFAYCFIMFCYLAKDLVDSFKMIFQSACLGSRRKGVFAGFVVLYVNICTAVISALYSYSTGISNTDILKDAVILLFLNEIDERLFLFIIQLRPIWVKKVRAEIAAHFDKKRKAIRSHMENLVSTSGNDNNEDKQNSVSDPQKTNKDAREEGSELNISKARVNWGADDDETKTAKRMTSGGVYHELRVADHKTMAQEILVLKDDIANLQNAHRESQNYYHRQELSFTEAEHEVRNLKFCVGQEIRNLNEMIQNTCSHK